MKIIYFSETFFTDCDFPLIRELQNMGIDIKYFFPITNNQKRQALIDLKSIKKRFGIFKASKYPEMSIYKDYINLDKIYLINIPEGKRRIWQLFFWSYVYIYILLMRPTIFHYTWQLTRYAKILYKLPCKKVMTVHDPLSHSCITNPIEEKERLQAFKYANKYILLSKALATQFEIKYSICKSNISFTKMGEFNFLRCINTKPAKLTDTYILFFGQIASHKGIEYLCEAVKMLHTKFPNVNLVIAGRGNIYFDFKPYENLNYIKLINEYIPISNLSEILQNALFAVCPYKDATQSGVVQMAFSTKTPLIVTNVGDLPIAVKDGVTGTVIPPCNSQALANAIDDLLSNSHKLDQYRKNIDKIWLPNMAWGNIANDYLKVWTSLTKSV